MTKIKFANKDIGRYGGVLRAGVNGYRGTKCKNNCIEPDKR